MKRLAILLLVPLMTTVAVAAPDAKLLAKGQAILDKNCSRCHAIGKDGASPHEKAPPFREVVTRYAAETLAESLAEGLVSGHPDMPEFVFEPPEIDAIIAYLDSLGGPAKR